MQESQRFIYVWAEDKPGVLIRITNILTAKGINIDRLIAGPDASRSGISRITVIASFESRWHKRVIDEINRLIHVLVVIDATELNGMRVGAARQGH